MKRTLLFSVLLVLTIGSGIVIAQDDTEAAKAAKRADIERLMAMTGSGDLGVQVMEQMIGAFKQNVPGVPNEFWEGVMAEVDPNELVELCIPSYEKHFTHDEIKELIAFYETPIGKKLIQKQPLIMQECMVVGQEWGQELAQKVMKKLKDEGF